jgi:hypothetical protein
MEPHPYAAQMDEERKRIRATPEYAAHRTRRARATLQMAERLPSLPGQVPMSKSLGYLQLHDLVHALQAEGAAWPGLVEESLAKEASRLVSEFWCFCFHNDNVLRYSLWPLMSEIGDNIERALSGRAAGPPPPPPLVLFAGHDTTIMPLLAALRCLKVGHWPPYAASLAFELLEDTGKTSAVPVDSRFFMRVRYNGSPLRIPGAAADGLWPLAGFRSHWRQFQTSLASPSSPVSSAAQQTGSVIGSEKPHAKL